MVGFSGVLAQPPSLLVARLRGYSFSFPVPGGPAAEALRLEFRPECIFGGLIEMAESAISVCKLSGRCLCYHWSLVGRKCFDGALQCDAAMFSATAMLVVLALEQMNLEGTMLPTVAKRERFVHVKTTWISP